MSGPRRWGTGLKTALFTVVVIVSNVLGNFCLSRGMRGAGAAGDAASLPSLIGSIFTPWVALGIVLLIVWMLTRMTLLSWADLSYVLPVTAVGYVLTALIGKYWLGEQVTPARWGGATLIMLGAMLAGATPHRTTPVSSAGEPS